MKKPIALSLLALVFATPSMVHAGKFEAHFEHPCEIAYYRYMLEEASHEKYLKCLKAFPNKTKLLKSVEKYDRALEKRIKKVEKIVEERELAAKEKRAAKYVKTFTMEDMLDSDNNPLGIPYAAEVVRYKNNGKIETEEVDEEKICKELGFESAVEGSVKKSRRFDDGIKADREEAPKQVYEIYSSWGSKKVRVLSLDAFRNRDHGLAFSYFMELGCERNLKDGEEIQDFVVDIELIKRQVEREIDAPELTHDMKKIMGMLENTDNGNRDEDEDRYGERREEREEDEEEEWTPTNHGGSEFQIGGTSK